MRLQEGLKSFIRQEIILGAEKISDLVIFDKKMQDEFDKIAKNILSTNTLIVLFIRDLLMGTCSISCSLGSLVPKIL